MRKTSSILCYRHETPSFNCPAFPFLPLCPFYDCLAHLIGSLVRWLMCPCLNHGLSGLQRLHGLKTAELFPIYGLNGVILARNVRALLTLDTLHTTLRIIFLAPGGRHVYRMWESTQLSPSGATCVIDVRKRETSCVIAAAQPNLRVTISLILCPMNRATTVNPWTPALFRREQRSLFRANIVYFITVFYLSI